MGIQWTLYFKMLAGLFAVLNPLGAVPLFASLTQTRTAMERRHIARVASCTVLFVLAVAAVGGEPLLGLFGITLASFRIGGGILILLMAIAMLHAKRSGAKGSAEESAEAVDRQDIAVVPLGLPMLAGPGSISTVILYRHQAKGAMTLAAIAVIICAVALSVYLVLNFATPLISRLGKTWLNIINRVMGLVLASLAVEFIAEGLIDFFPILATGAR